MGATRMAKCAMVSLVLSLGVVAGSLRAPWPVERRICGHPKSFGDGLASWPLALMPQASHCCSSGRLVSNLRLLWELQESFRSDRGRFATTLEELELAVGGPLEMPQPCQISSDGTNWTISVPKVAPLAGAYLLTASGKLYFHEHRIPTTNDHLLCLHIAP